MTAHDRPTFTWLGHSTLRCDLPGGEVVVIDPFIEQNPATPEAARRFERLDLILVTHAHGDHMADAVGLAKRHGALVIATYDLCGWLASQGVERTSGMNLGGTQSACGLRITQVRADHTSGVEHEGRIVYGGVATGFVVRTASGYCFYHAGDTALFSDMQLIGELYRPDLAFLPIGDHFTMDPVAGRARLPAAQRPPRGADPLGDLPAAARPPRHLVDAIAHLGGCRTEVVELEPGRPWTPPD